MGGKNTLKGGTGARLGDIVVILTGVFALASILLTVLTIWLQTKNYRKPLLQRYVVRILLLVPFFAGASWASLVSLKASFWIEPFRDVYEVGTQSSHAPPLLTIAPGFHNLRLLPAAHQLHWWRTSTYYPHARTAASLSPVAIESLSGQSRHLRSTHVPCY